MTIETVEFSSGDGRCAGDLYLPENGGSGQPAIVIGHGFSFVKEALGEEGKRFSEAGFVTLAIDYRSFGESPGEPRGQLFPLNQVEDYRNAISYLETRDEVDSDRIGIWGTSFGGATVIYTGGVELRAKAVVAQVPVVNGRRWMQALRVSDTWIELQDALVEDRRERFRSGKGARVRAARLPSDGEVCAMQVDSQIMGFLEEAQKNLKTWRPDITLESVEKVIEFVPESVIHQIAPRPLLIVATAGYDMIHPMDQLLEAYQKAQEPKRLALLPYDQTGLYSDPGLGEAMAEAIGWFQKYL